MNILNFYIMQYVLHIIHNTIFELILALARTTPSYHVYVIVLLAAIERLYPATAIENKDENLLIIEIIRYINDNFRDNITLEIISEHFGYSKYYFSRFFNKHFNCNLNTYLGGIRLKTAENLILKGINVTDAVITSGINSLSTYYRLKRQNQSI